MTEAQAWAESATDEPPSPLPHYPSLAEALRTPGVMRWLHSLSGWDGAYDAACPHGHITTWNAHRMEPQCTCPEMDT